MKITAKKILNKILTVCLMISLIVGITPAAFVKAAPTVAISGTVNNSGNYISLNWSNSDLTGSYRYMVTKKDGSSTTYQTIPLKRTAKVLNIYPGGGTPIAGRTDLEGRQLDTSANVKLWMEEEGVGKSNGNTLIKVDCINITDFNNNPDNYLKKDTSGNYNYDVVFTGAWDNNNNCDLTSSSETVIQSFITAGGGYLGGHDTTTGYNNAHPNFNTLAENNLNMAIDDYTMIPLYGGSTPTATIDINIVKKGSLINYPWTVSGTTLTVPSSHSTHQFAMGDVWMKYASSEFNTIETTSFNGNAGTNNFYLTTWNNAAMIQTGHSNGNATIDEKKILANTLLYLAQISTETSFDDHTAQDVTAPNSIDASTVQINVDADKKATVTFAASEDIGNTYSYRLKAIGMTDNSTTWSEPISQTIMSGMNGYAVVVDKIAATVPGDTVTTTDCTYETTALSAGNWYVHIKAIDKVGNASSVIHVPFTVSQTAPTATTAAASSITLTGAVLNATVNTNSESTAVTFEYGTSTSYGASVSAVGSPVSGASESAVSATVSDLLPNTTYHYRVKAVNAGGTSYGSDQTFTTAVFYPTELVNGGFEYPSLSGKASNGQWWYDFYPFATSGIAAGTYNKSGATDVITGFNYNQFNWNTTAQGSKRYFEVGTKPDVASWGVQFVPEGDQFIELNAIDVTATYQDLATTPGQVIYWSLYQGGVWYPAKPNINNTMAVRIGTQSQLTDTSMLVTSQTAFDQSWSNRVIYNINDMTEVTETPSAYNGKDSNKKQLYTEAKRWTKYEGIYVVPEGQTVTRFAFASLSTADPLSGNMLDGISFRTATAQETTELVIPATEISISGAGAADSITTNGGSIQMQSIISPSDATYQTVNWSVENGTGSASITQTGLLTAITNGTVTVKATAKDGAAVIGSKIITISGQDVPATSIDAAKAAAQNASYSDMTQATATEEAAIVDTLKTAAETAVNDNSIIITINKVGYTAPIAGTSANPSGTDGSYVFTITVSKDLQSQTTEQKTIRIAATAYTGVTDVQAVAAAMEALVDGSANVAFGADQATKTAEVQAYVNGILSSTANAAGVSAAVTYNSSTGKYEVTITKGSVSDSKSLTITLNVAPDPDIAAVDAAKAAAQNASYLDMTQETATGEAAIVSALKAAAEAAVGNSSVTITINTFSYTEPTAGTSVNPGGTNGSFVFTISVSKGVHNQTTEQKTISITAEAYTGITDEQAVAAAKEALVDGSAMIPFGADQGTKTAAVQAYVNGILSSTTDAAGVSAAVTYNSTTGQYEVTIMKGSSSDNKSLTMILNETTDPDIVVVNDIRLAVEGVSYADMAQAEATNETVIADSLKAAAVTAVTGGAIITVNKISYTAPISGTSANPSGTDGSYVFTITVSKGVQSQSTAQKTITIIASAYTGVTDVQAVAAIKAALVDGTVNVPYGADQAAIIAAVQAYVNDKLSSTADAVGVTAVVTYNSGTGKYEVALSKGSINDSKSLTMTVNAAPAPSGDSQTFVTKPETKTITVIEVPHSIPNERLLMVEPVGEAFDKSVEVRLKEDTITESMVRMVMESLSSTLNIENAQIFPLDISIYLKGTDTKVQPKEGTAVIITCPIPTAMLTNMDKLVVVCVIDEELKVLPSTLVMKDGVACAQFTATHFSPYAFVIDYDNNLADNAEGTSYDDVTHISANLTAAAGTLTKIDLDGIKEGSIITYHVCTPTLISIDKNGNLFTKKAGNAILMANVTYDGAVTTYTIHITVKKAKGGTKVGFIQYYDDIVSCNNINYRITAEATDKTEGTATVANNQINKNLPQKVVIPATITYRGKTYKVTSIDESAFYNMNKITSVTIPAGVEEISTTAFVSCDSLKTFTVSSDNKHYSAKKGMLLNKEGTILIAYPSAKGTIIIDKKIKVIGAYAFSACKYLTGVVIPKTVTRIEGCAFSHSKSLSKATFQSMTVPEIPFLGIFERVNEACTILVPGNHLSKYQTAFKNARMPKGASVIKSE